MKTHFDDSSAFVDELNNSDLLLADINVEEFFKPMDLTKPTASFAMLKNLEAVKNAENCNHNEEGNKITCNLNESARCDLFEEDEDEFSSIFFPKFIGSQQEKSSCKSEKTNCRQGESDPCNSAAVFKDSHYISDVVNHMENNSDDENKKKTCGELRDSKTDDKSLLKEISNKTISSSLRNDNVNGILSLEDKPIKTGGALSLKDRLKMRLLMNNSMTAPGPCNESRLREEEMEKARVEASQIRKEGTDVDIGPFYGLPSKVKELFKELRGIEKFYGEN